MSKSKIWLVAATLAAASLSLAGCTSEAPAPDQSAEEIVTVRVATNNAVGQLPVVIGIQEGFFNEHGLDVQQTVVPNITLIPASVGKTFDFGYTAGPIFVNSVASGLPLTAISSSEIVDEDNTPTHLLAAKDVHELTDLEGKTVGAVTLTGALHLATLAMLQEAGVDTSTINFVQIDTPNMLDQLAAGQVQAVELQEPFLTGGIAQGFTDLGDMIGPAMGYPTVLTFYIADAEWADANSTVVDNYRAALDESMAWIAANPEEARAALAEATGVSEDQTKSIGLGQFRTALTSEDVEKWGILMKKVAGFAGTVNYDDVVLPYEPEGTPAS